MLHSADVSNPAKSMDIYMEWTDRVMKEFYDQVRRVWRVRRLWRLWRETVDSEESVAQ